MRHLVGVGFLLAAGVGLSGCGGGGAGATTPPAPAAVCGNGQTEIGEECDDGNNVNGDGCYTTCQRPVNWVPSDVHIHSTGCGVRTSPEEAERQLRRQEIKVGAALVWGDGFHVDAPHFTGRDHPLSRPDFLLHYDLEVSAFAAGNAGHLLLLGLDSLGFSDDVFRKPRSGVPVLEWARRQPRVVTGMAHGQFWPAGERFPRPPVVCCIPWEFPIHLARGRLDFLSFEKLPLDQGPVDEGTFRLWRAALNSGFRLALTGASDWPCITHTFSDRTPRTDVIVDGDLSYERWLQGIKAGRTAAAIGYGERLHVRVNGRGVGDELRLPSPQEVTVTLESIDGRPAEVDVLVNGAPAAHLRLDPGVQVAQLKLPLERSAWIAARSARIQTSAVYVIVGGQPIRASAEDTCFLMRYTDHVYGLVQEHRLDLGDDEAEALAAYDEALTELRKRFQEAGGQTCN